jgi:hypothetical protein
MAALPGWGGTMIASTSKVSSGAALAEVSMAEASPEISRIYKEISRSSGIPLPALIWRHLATMPNVLRVAWDGIGPLYSKGLVQQAAWGAVETTLAGHRAGLSRSRLLEAGFDVEAVENYTRVLGSYNRANPVNFVGVRILRSAMAKSASGSATALTAMPDWQPPDPILDLAPMVPVPKIPSDLRRKIDSLATTSIVDRAQVVPSLYRHLVHWPQLIELVHGELSPRIESGELAGLVAKVSLALEGEAERLAPYVRPMPELANADGVVDALTRFSALIPELVAIGYLLDKGLEDNGA